MLYLRLFAVFFIMLRVEFFFYSLLRIRSQFYNYIKQKAWRFSIFYTIDNSDFFIKFGLNFVISNDYKEFGLLLCLNIIWNVNYIIIKGLFMLFLRIAIWYIWNILFILFLYIYLVYNVYAIKLNYDSKNHDNIFYFFLLYMIVIFIFIILWIYFYDFI